MGGLTTITHPQEKLGEMAADYCLKKFEKSRKKKVKFRD